MLKIQNLTKSFDKRIILDDVNLDFKENQITFIVGTSGSGKTTLLNLIGGLDLPDKGEVLFENINILENINDFRSQRVGFVFQDYNLIAGLSLVKNIEIGASFSNKRSLIKIADYLDLYSLKDPNQDVNKLSGGEKQRCAIARAVIKNAEIILADEPTGNLDSKNADTVFSEFVKLKTNKYIIIVTHDMEKAKKYADRIINIKDGKVIEDAIINKTEIPFKKEKQKNRKKGLRLKPIILLGNNSIKQRFSKMILISLVLALLISSISMVISFKFLGESIANRTNKYYLETDLVSIFWDNSTNAPIKTRTFNNIQIEKIKEKYGDNIVETYGDVYINYSFSNKNIFKQSTIKQILINSKFEERVMSNNIIGTFIEYKNDVILAEDIAKYLYGENLDSIIGSIVILNNSMGQSVELVIKGINKTINSNGEIYSFVSNDILRDLKQENLHSKLNEPLILQPYINNIGVSYGGLKSIIKFIDNTENLLYGRYPQTSNEILLSHSQLNYALKMFNIDLSFENSTILEGKIGKEILENLFHCQATFIFDDLHIVNIVGVFQDESLSIKFLDETISQMQTPKPNVLELYLDNINESEKIVSSINDYEEFSAFSNYKKFIDNVLNQTRFFEIALLAIGFILFITIIFMIGSFSKLNISERTKEIAIIKSLGASSLETYIIMIYDFLFIDIVAIFLAMLISIIWMYVVPNFLPAVSFSEFQYPFIPLILTGLTIVILSLFQYTVSLKKILKKQPALLFKKSL